MTKRPVRSLCSMLVLAFILCGCLNKRSENVRLLWPPPPAQQRLEFVGVYASQNDFPKNRWQKTLEILIGNVHTKDAFRAPQDIYADGGGRVFVSDLGVRNVVLFDFAKKSVGQLFDGTGLEEPLGLAGDKKGNLFVADGKSKKIRVFSSGGALLYSFGNDELLARPEYMAVNHQNGRLYVSDSLASRIVVFDLKGKHLFSFGQHGDKEGEFHTPHGLAIDSKNRLFVADAGNARIQVFDANGRFQYQFGQKGNRVHHFMKPVDVAFDSEGHLYILDQKMRALLTYTPEGEVLLATGTGKPSNKRLGLLIPTSIHIDRNDRIFIADTKNHRFSIWQYLSNSYLLENPISEKDREQFKAYVSELKVPSPKER